MFHKSKAFDPNQIVIQQRVMVAEFKIVHQKEKGTLQAFEKGFQTAMERKKAPEAMDYAHKIVISQRRVTAMEKINDALTYIRNNAPEIAGSKSIPENHKAPLQILCCAATYLRINSFNKFRTVLIKDMFGPPAVQELSNTATLDPEVVCAFEDLSIPDEALNEAIIDLSKRLLQDQTLIESVLHISPPPKQPEVPKAAKGVSYSQQQPPTGFAPQAGIAPQPGFAPQAGYVPEASGPSEPPSSINLDNVFAPSVNDAFDRVQWPQLSAAVREALD